MTAPAAKVLPVAAAALEEDEPLPDMEAPVADELPPVMVIELGAPEVSMVMVGSRVVVRLSVASWRASRAVEGS